MGKRGPRPTPKAVLASRGSRLAKSRKDEPTSKVSIPDKPTWLGPIAAAKWDEIVPGLVEQGIMSALYGDFLALYCQAHQDLHDALKTLKKEGTTCVSEKGGKYLHPAIAIKQSAIDRIAKFGREFGLSAASIRDVSASTIEKRKTGLSASARKR